ncbi:GGDEF [gamma proteobacterium HdN1]|nr:GGDEF [gamma proteobacterium HdN1]
MENDGDMLHFVEEQEQPAHNLAPCWQILLVDDEPDVHTATKLALKNLTIEGRPLRFSHAYSAAEARAMLADYGNFAVAIIDVVMETDRAGLELVRYIRETLNNQALRLILRTGQPGYAPELSTIAEYDINDYRTKTELTQARLFTSLTIAIRSFEQIHQLEANRQGLEQILAAAGELSKPIGLQKFATGIATQICALLKVDAECLVCAAMHEPEHSPYVLAAAGKYSKWIGLPLENLPDASVKALLEKSLTSRQHLYEQGACLYFRGADDQALAAYVQTAQPLELLERRLLEVFCSNISGAFENLQLYLTISELAYNDSLVGLPNRNALISALENDPVQGQCLALLDIDSFSDINSILDDRFGDEVLKAVAARLRTSFSEATFVARLSSDLFALYGSATQVHPKSIAKIFAEPFLIFGQEALRLSATSGLVLLTGSDALGVELLKNAGAALKQAKRHARGKAIYFKEAQSAAARDRIKMLNDLRNAVSAHTLELYYQPFVRLKDRAVIGAECLLRWKATNGKFISPDTFIPIAERSGLMVPIGDWVTKTALRWRKRLEGKFADDFKVAINVSHVQFSEPNFVAKMLAALDEAGVPGHHVEIELTESIAIENLELLQARIEMLRTANIHLSMDDFGTGYSSLNVLQHMHLDRLKIDRSFVSGDASDDFNMVRTILAMAGHLNLNTIAEGIETQAQLDLLVKEGCDDGQGYFFSKPLPEAEFALWLANFR